MWMDLAAKLTGQHARMGASRAAVHSGTRSAYRHKFGSASFHITMPLM